MILTPVRQGTSHQLSPLIAVSQHDGFLDLTSHHGVGTKKKKKTNDRSVLFSIQQLHSTLQSLMQAALSPHCLEHAGKAPLGCARYCATWALPCSAFVATACIMTLTSQAVVTKNVMYPDQFGIRGQRFYCCQQGVVICIVNNALLDRDE